MEGSIGLIFSCISLVINIVATIVSSYTLACLIYREWRLRDINVLLVINTYTVVVLWSGIQVSANIFCILGDTQTYVNVDSIACHAHCYVYLYLVTWLFSSFILQAYVRMLNIVRSHHDQLHSMGTVSIWILITYVSSFVLVVPTYFLNVIVYTPTDYQCVVDIRSWKGTLYMFWAFYSIPIGLITGMYIRVIRFVRQSTLRNQQHRQTITGRDLLMIQRILILLLTLIVLGLPSLILWLYSIITGRLYPFTYRLQALSLATSICTLAFAVALTNPQVKGFLFQFGQRHVGFDLTVHPQRH